jgi:hypothetical protein
MYIVGCGLVKSFRCSAPFCGSKLLISFDFAVSIEKCQRKRRVTHSFLSFVVPTALVPYVFVCILGYMKQLGPAYSEYRGLKYGKERWDRSRLGLILFVE